MRARDRDLELRNILEMDKLQRHMQSMVSQQERAKRIKQQPEPELHPDRTHLGAQEPQNGGNADDDAQHPQTSSHFFFNQPMQPFYSNFATIFTPFCRIDAAVSVCHFYMHPAGRQRTTLG